MTSLPPVALVAVAQTADPERIRATVEEVLSRPAYDGLRRDPVREALAIVRRAVAEWLAGLLTSSTGGVLGWLLLLVVAIIAGLAIWRLVHRLRRDPTARDVTTAARGATVADHLAAARAAEAAGDLHAAVAARYRALVLSLITRGILDDIPGMTSGEIRRAVADRAPGERARIDDASDAFERVWYAHEPAGRHHPRLLAATAPLDQRASVGAGSAS